MFRRPSSFLFRRKAFKSRRSIYIPLLTTDVYKRQRLTDRLLAIPCIFFLFPRQSPSESKYQGNGVGKNERKKKSLKEAWI